MKNTDLNTRAVKTYLDGSKAWRPLSVPLVQATNFQFATSEELGAAFRSKGAHHDNRVYTRFGHPTIAVAGAKVAALEGAEAGILFGSGMAAITTALIAALSPGDHVVAQREIFAQTFTFLDTLARSWGIQTTFVDATDLDRVADAMRSDTKLVYVETPSNPLLRVVDIAGVSEIAESNGALLFVDSTFASPYLQNPLELGATLVLHSATKFLGGHSDVMAGAAVGDAGIIDKLKETQFLLGGVSDPHAAWLLLRGIKTLAMRVQRQSDNAYEIARYLEEASGITSVHYPWLDSSPGSGVARRQMRGGGGVVSFEVDGGLPAARSFLDALKLIPIATSLGGVETIIEIPYDLDFGADDLGEEAAASTGISPGLIRLSVGCEDPQDLLDDLARGVEAVANRGPTAA